MKIYRALFDGIKEDVALKCVKDMQILVVIPDFMVILSDSRLFENIQNYIE